MKIEGRVGAEVTEDQGYAAAAKTALAVVSALPFSIPVEVEAEVVIRPARAAA